MFSLKDQRDLQEIPDQDWDETYNMGNLTLNKNYDQHKALADAQPMAV